MRTALGVILGFLGGLAALFATACPFDLIAHQ